jgi:hypothetical protein
MVNMGNVWDRTTEFLSDNLGAVVPVALLTIFVPQSISKAISQAGPQVAPGLSIGVVLLLLLPMIWGQLAVTALALDPEAGRSAAKSAATRRVGQVLLAMLIPFVIILILSLPIVFAWVKGSVDVAALVGASPGPRADISQGAVQFIRLYGAALIVFAVFLSVRLSTLLMPIVVVEGGVIGALRRSFALSSGISWKLFGVVLLFAVVMGVASIAITSAFGILFRVLEPAAGPFSVGSIIVAILGGLVTTAYYVVQSSFMAKVYLAATSAREGV